MNIRTIAKQYGITDSDFEKFIKKNPTKFVYHLGLTGIDIPDHHVGEYVKLYKIHIREKRLSNMSEKDREKFLENEAKAQKEEAQDHKRSRVSHTVNHSPRVTQSVNNTNNGGMPQKIEPKKCEYHLVGCRGREISVYDDRVVISTKVTIGSILTRNATDGEKIIFYQDIVGIQYKAAGVTIGYIQLETPSAQMNNLTDNTFSENTFTFENNDSKIEEVKDYIVWQVSKRKH